MKLSYYPGCSLHGTALDYDTSVRDVCAKLHIELVEIPDWNCCGASSGHMTDHEIGMRLPMRNLLLAQRSGHDILVPCAACYQRLKVADKVLRQNPHHWDVDEYRPDFEIIHVTTLLSRPEIVEKMRPHLTASLGEMVVACYYGCLSLRPPEITPVRHPEMPTTLETIVESLGGKTVVWSHKTECCSGSLTMTRPDISRKLVADIVLSAKRAGATALVTDCPMCQANVESRQLDNDEVGAPLPVFFATELIAAAMQNSYPQKQAKVHLVSPEIIAKHLTDARRTAREEAL